MRVAKAHGANVLWCLPLIVQLFLSVALAYQGNAPATSQSKDQGDRPVTEPVPPRAPPEKQVSGTVNHKREAWLTLETACAGDKAIDRANATRVLGLIRNDAKATKLAEKALTDPKPEVRAAAAAALGDLHSRRSIPKLEKALDDQDPSVALAAANSLRLMRNVSAYEVYSEVLSKQRRSGKGLVSSQMSTLSDPKKMAQLGFEEGIGFVPFAGIGWRAIKEVRKDDSSPIRAAAARVLADDPDPAATKVLVDAAGDKSWLVRTAALEALARRGDPSALETVELYLLDDKDVVRYTAAASTLRLIKSKEAKVAKKLMQQAMK